MCASEIKHGEIVIVVPCGRPKVPDVLSLPPEVRGHVYIGLNNMTNIQRQQLKKKLKAFEEITILDVSETGAMSARRKITMEVPQSCRYLICVDDDVTPGPSYFTQIRNIIQKYPNSVIFGVLKQRYGTGLSEKFQYWWQCLGKINFKRWLPAYYIAGNCIWPKRIAESLFNQIGLRYLAGGEEIEGFYLLKKNEIPMIYCPGLFCEHQNKSMRQLIKTFFKYGEGQAIALYQIQYHEKCGPVKAFFHLLGSYKREFNPITVNSGNEFPLKEKNGSEVGKRIIIWLSCVIMLKITYFFGFTKRLVSQMVRKIN